MASQIDPTVPSGTQAFAGELRANLQAAKDEIEALQAGGGGALGAEDDTSVTLPALPTSGPVLIDFSQPVEAFYPGLDATDAVTFALDANPRDGARVRFRFRPNAAGTSFPASEFALDSVSTVDPETILSWTAGAWYTLELVYDAQLGRALLSRLPGDAAAIPTGSIKHEKLAASDFLDRRTFSGELVPDVNDVFYSPFTMSGPFTASKGAGDRDGSVHYLPLTTDSPADGMSSTITWNSEYVLVGGGTPPPKLPGGRQYFFRFTWDAGEAVFRTEIFGDPFETTLRGKTVFRPDTVDGVATKVEWKIWNGTTFVIFNGDTGEWTTGHQRTHVNNTYDLGSGPIRFRDAYLSRALHLSPYTVASAPSASALGAGALIHVSDGDAGARCLALSDGTDWLRITLGAAISSS